MRWWWVLLLVLLVLPVQAQQPIEFSIGGPLAYGGAEWQANGLINRLIFYQGETIEVGMAVGMRLPDGDVTLPYRMRGALALKQIHTANGLQLPYDPRETWSPFTAGGMPLTNVTLPVRVLQTSETQEITIVDERTLSFTLGFRAILPDDLDNGVYAVMLLGSAAVGDSEEFDWYQNRIFSTTGTGDENAFDQRLPLVIRVGDVAPPQVEWVLNRTTLPQESFSVLANQRTIVQPPGGMNLVPALAGLSFPLQVPSGGLTGRIESLGTRRLLGTGFTEVQNTVNLPFTTFTGGAAAGSYYQLTVADPAYQVQFVRYGVYRVVLRGTISDRFGTQYRGGGTYEVVIAEPLAVTPRIPDGYPLPAGQPLALGFAALPGVTGQAEIVVEFEPASGAQPSRRLFIGSLRAGYFVVNEPLTFDEPGVYRIRYRAQALDTEDRLWFGERVSVGVVTGAEATIQARGRRGLDGYTRNPQANFDSRIYPFDAVLDQTLVNTPYNPADVVTLAPAADVALRPVLTFQDLQGEAAARLLTRLRGFTNPEGDLAELLRRDSLPVVYPGGYGFLTLSVPAGQVNTMAQGNADGIYTPRIDLTNLPLGTLMTWFGGVRLADPSLTSGYGAGVILGDVEGARVEAADDVAPRWLVLNGGEGTLIPFGQGSQWWIQSIPTRTQGPLSVRVTAPNGAVVRVPAQPLGDYGLVHVAVDAAVLDQVGVWQLALQDDQTRQTYATARWIVMTPAHVLTMNDTPTVTLTSGQATVRAAVPTGWRNMRGTVIVSHPQGIVDEREVNVTGQQWSIALNRAEWLRRLPWAGVGSLRLTLILTGQDAEGVPVFAVRQLTIQAGRVIRVD